MQYKFYLARSTDTTLGTSYPVVWLDGHTRNTDREGSRRYMRQQISQPFILRPGSGYEPVLDAGSTVRWRMTIQEVQSDGTELPFFVGTFTRVESKVNRDHQRIEVKLTPEDSHTRLTDNQNEDYNFLRLGIDPVAVQYQEYPLVQVWFEGNRRLFNLQPGNNWLSDVGENLTNNGEILEDPYHFGPEQVLGFVPGGVSSDIQQSIFGSWTYVADPDTRGRSNDVFRHPSGLEFRPYGGTRGLFSGPSGTLLYEIGGYLGDAPEGSGGTTPEVDPGRPTYTRYTSGRTTTNPDGGRQLALPLIPAGSDSGTTAAVVVFVVVIYRARVLINAEEFNGQETFEKDEFDIYARDLSYQRVAPFVASGFFLFDGNSSEDQGLGLFSSSSLHHAGRYFVKPAGFDYQEVLPTSWSYASMWLNWNPTERQMIENAAETITVNDCYLLTDVIQAVTKEASEGAVTDFSSQLLNAGLDPITGAVSPTLVVVPKSNVLVKNYSNAATAGNVKFSELMELLRVIRNAEYFLEGSVLVSEHIEWFENGGSYTSPVVGANLTLEVEPRTGLPWEFRSDEFTYDGVQIPERYKFQAMDPASPRFAGVDIVMESEMAKGGGSTDFAARQFSFDLDFSQANAPSVQETGFFLLQTFPGTNAYTVARPSSGPLANVQNGGLAFPQIQQDYFRHGLPVRLARINGELIQAETVQRTRQQSLVVPTNPNLDTIQLVKTSMGDGLIKSISYNMLTGKSQILLLHEPE